MTATATPPGLRPPAEPAAPPSAPPARPAAPVLAPVALALVTLAAGLGFGRLFLGLGFAGPVVLSALTGHAVAAWGRARRLPTALAAVATLAAVALVGAWTVLGETTFYGIPTGTTLSEAAYQLRIARTAFAEVVAPAAVLDGFVIACVLAVGVAAFMADWAAFRLATPLEACIPSLTLFLFTAALGGPRHRTAATVAWVGAVLLFQVAFALGRLRPTSWFGGRPGRGPAAMLATAAVLTAVAVAAGLVVGPRLPGAGEEPVIAYREQDGSQNRNRTTVSPLVDIRGRLVNRSDIEVFTVRSTARAYWRLTALDRFDGSIWSSNDTYRPSGDQLPSTIPPDVPDTRVVQEFEVTGLASIWLPAAYEARRVESDQPVSYNAESGSLITDEETTDGQRYRVVSEVPTFDRAELAGAPPVVPPDLTRYLDLPAIPRRVVELAARLTAPHDTPYERALALQAFFRDPDNFRYDLRITQGHDGRALERFLFGTRRGYCEQFAGAYAVLARLAGLPARVAVGFTPGDLGDDGAYHVRDEHAHAWPEVWIAGAGWVAFEPTPGRGRPNAEHYTGIPEQQLGGHQTTSTTSSASAPTTAPAPADGEAPQPFPTLPEDASDAADPLEQDRPVPLLVRVALAAVALAVLAGLWLLVAAAVRAARHRRRRAGASTPSAAVELAWTEAAEALTRLGLPRRPAETPLEYARRVTAGGAVPTVIAADLRRLAADASAAAYAGDELAEDVATRSAATVAALQAVVRDEVGPAQRFREAFDPRPPVTVRAAPVRRRPPATA